MKTRCVPFFALALAAWAPAQNLRSQVYATGFSWPVAMVQDPTDPSVQFVVQQRGLVRVVVNGAVQGTDFLNLSGIVHQTHSEGGLLGLAFHPDYATNRQFYVNYTDTGGTTRIVRYLRNAVNPLVADPGSAHPILSIAQPFSNHNGGTLRFGPLDGYLYIGMGDGGSGNDPGNRAQNKDLLLGKMLRIDVDQDDFPTDPAKNYGNPSDNPFVGTAGADEVWSYGLRNPWKWSFDNPLHLGNGGMTIGDVGQNAWEEVDYEPPLIGGRNYGWRHYEGNALTGNGGGDGGPYTFPIHVYSHAVGVSITGGYVYRGLMLGDYFGRYFFADYGSNRVWSFQLVIDPFTGEGSAANVVEHTADIATGNSLTSSIDVDANGELYFLDYRGGGLGRVVKLLPENRVWATGLTPVNNTGVSGDLRALSAGDGKLLLTRRGLTLSAGEGFRSTFLLDMRTDMAAPSFFDVFVDVNAVQNLTPGGLEVRMRNWNTGQLEVVGVVPVTTSMETRQILNIPAANYRRASDGAVQLQLQAFCTGLLIAANPTVRYDRLKVAVR